MSAPVLVRDINTDPAIRKHRDDVRLIVWQTAATVAGLFAVAVLVLALVVIS